MMKSILLGSGVSAPMFGFGTWQLKGDECIEGVRYALELGYTHIDTADAYGNHREVAEGIRRSGVKREDMFITTKVWNTDHAHDDVINSGKRFLEELGIEYIDLLLIHWPVSTVPIAETLGAMDELKKIGAIRAIGVSNFTKHHLEDALKTGVEFVNNQVEVHPTFNQKEMREFCKSKNIAVTAYSPLGRGGDLKLPLMTELAGKYNATPAQIALSWVLSRDMIAIPKSATPARIKENLGAITLEMEEADLMRIDNLEQGPRMANPAFNEFDY